MKKIKWNKQFEYPTSTRALIDGKRHYDVGTEDKLPSVTTILAATQSEEKKASLAKWKERVGTEQANRIKDQAAARGTTMHRYLEGWLEDNYHIDLTDTGQLAEKMAYQIYDQGLRGKLSEIYGSEVTLYYPGLYAGATDVVGIYDGCPSIVDFKQSNKPKRKEWIHDYGLQLAAYAMAHNYVYGTKITKGVNLICTKDLMFQKFEFEGEEFRKLQYEWLKRVDQYHEEVNKNVVSSE